MGNTVGSRQSLSDDYLAGFFDGDGSVVATLERYNSTRFPYRIRLKVNFTQHARYQKILVQIQQALGGYGIIRTNERKQLSELVIQNRNQVRAVLMRLAPKLAIKNRQAQLGIRILDRLAVNEKHQPSNLSDKAYSHVLKLIQDIRDLNSGTGGKRNTKIA
jgi:hypothetical protein